MSDSTRIVSPGPDDGSVLTAEGEMLRPPADWVLVPPGDAALTRRVKLAGPTWAVQQKRGRRTFSLGLWAAEATVEAIRADLAVARDDPRHARKLEAAAGRRERQQAEYVAEFRRAVLDYLGFHARHAELAERLAAAVTAHATPVGSGTVARTRRIPIAERAEAAVIAWMRHQTTGYDQLAIPRVKGRRREIRRLLAGQSKSLLYAYREGKGVDPASCPLQRALIGEAEPSASIPA